MQGHFVVLHSAGRQDTQHNDSQHNDTQQGAKTLSITTVSITTLSIKGLYLTLSTNDSANDTQHSNAFNIMLSKMTLNVTFYLFNAECHYAVSLHAECCYAECGALSYPMALLANLID